MQNYLKMPVIYPAHIFVTVLVLLFYFSFIQYANAVDQNNICDSHVMENGMPFSKDITLTAKNGSSLLIKQTCPLGQSYLEVNVFDLTSNKSLQIFNIEEEDDNLFPTIIKDVNLDGYPDLMFPVSTGNANSWHSIWFYDPSQRRFHKVLEEGFIDFFKDKRGYFVASGRASCCTWEYHFYIFSQWELKPKFAISVEAPDEQNKKSRCKMWSLGTTAKKNKEQVRDSYLRDNYCTHYENKVNKNSVP